VDHTSIPSAPSLPAPFCLLKKGPKFSAAAERRISGGAPNVALLPLGACKSSNPSRPGGTHTANSCDGPSRAVRQLAHKAGTDNNHGARRDDERSEPRLVGLGPNLVAHLVSEDRENRLSDRCPDMRRGGGSSGSPPSER